MFSQVVDDLETQSNISTWRPPLVYNAQSGSAIREHILRRSPEFDELPNSEEYMFQDIGELVKFELVKKNSKLGR